MVNHCQWAVEVIFSLAIVPWHPSVPPEMSTLEGAKPQLPSYLTESLIKSSLENDLQRTVTIDRFSAGPATASGDNYLSDVFWIRVQYDAGASETRLLAKCMPDVGDRGATLDVLDAFRKETEAFMQLLPQFSRLLVPANGERFGAKCYYATTEPVRTIVFEDLKALGFRMCDRTQGGLDYAHLELVMRKIAKFHAASMLYAAQGPEQKRRLAEGYSYGFYNPREKPEDFRILQVFQKGLEKFLSVASGWDELEPAVLKALDALQPTYNRRIAECVNPRQPGTRVHVLNHGDLWSNNMMFRYDEDGAVQEVMLVDYQLSCYGSPGLDLVYSLYNCPRQDVRRDRLEDLLQLYHRTLCETLRQAGHSVLPTLDDIKQEYARHEFFGLACAISLLPILMMERSSDVEVNFEAFFDEEQAERIRNIQYNGAQYRQVVVPLLHSLHARGYMK